MKHLASEVGNSAAAFAALAVRRLAVEDVESARRWDDFVERCPAATFFHLSGWQRVLGDVLRHRTHYLFAERAGRIEGVLPLAHVSSAIFGNALSSLPFAVYAGAAADGAEAADVLEQAAERLAGELGVTHLELRHRERRHPDWPSQDLYYTFRKAILPDVDANLLAVPRKQRAMVRKGIKYGLRSEIDGSVDRFYELYADNVHRHGTPALSRRYFAALQDVFGERCEILTVVTPQGQPVSSVLSFYFRDEVLPYYAGDDVAARDLAANDFKYWELMRRACERGLRWFEYGRSKRDTGPYAFKVNWGFEPQPLAYEYRLYGRDDVPQNNPANPKYRAVIAIWRRLPRAVVDRLGPWIVRNLG